ncbi:hypothetical protein DVH05_009556 [Phytophthora capsici]|nr:hypothetical protein DVH05_009556 [Phytophthora capsici]|eukprot:jgi/Phyca11/17486/fgenesh1_pg.PHYCAscaffold_28_\
MDVMKVKERESLVVTSADAAVPVRALGASNDKRSLRYYDCEDDNETDGYDQKNEEEERGVMTPDQITKWTAKAEEWAKLKKSPAYIKDKLTNMKGVLTPKNHEKYQLFMTARTRNNLAMLDE